jgi:hypothetical protein
MLAGKEPNIVGRAYSVDLRERVVGAVCKGGLSPPSASLY